VCSTSGAVLVLASRISGDLVFHCPFCGVAWATPPSPDQIEEVLTLQDVASGGVRLPTVPELRALDVEAEVADPYWDAAVDALVNE
jgi:hypothetical protein